MTSEQILAEISFERTDMAADGRGCQVQLFGCILDAAETCGGLESAHAIE